MPSRLRHILSITILVTIVSVLAALFVTGHGDAVQHVLNHVGELRPGPLLIGLVTSIMAMLNRGWMNRVAHEAVGLDARTGEMTRTAAVGFAAQKLVRSAGATSLAVFVRHGRRRGHAPGAVVAACMLTAAAAFLALGGLLAITVVTLSTTGRLTGWWLAAASGFALYTVVIAVVAAVILRSRTGAHWAWNQVQRLRRRSLQPMPTGWFDAIDVGRRRPTALVRLLGHALLGKLLGALLLAASVSATGLDVHPTEALIVYATALAVSMVSIVPGGVGVVEGSLIALFVAGGAAAAPAALAVAVFRVLDLWLPVLAGVVAARGELRLERAEHRDQPVPVVVGRPVPALV